jgi:amino acid adenylation domain-containing protein
MRTEVQSRIDRLSPQDRERLTRLLAGRRAQGQQIAAGQTRPQVVPLSYAQERMWLHQHLDGDAAALVVPRVYRLTGRLDLAALQRALNLVVERHEGLRTVFPADGGVPRQQVLDRATVEIERHDLDGHTGRDELSRLLIVKDVAAPIDITTRPPLRAALVRLGPDEHLLAFGVHHICLDEWSWGVFLRDLAAFYRQETGGPPAAPARSPVTCSDVALWQRRNAADGSWTAHLEYWRARLAGVHPVAVPADTRGGERHGRMLVRRVPAEFMARLNSVGTSVRAAQWITMLTPFALTLSRTLCQDDVVVAVPAAGSRTRPEVEYLITYMANMLPVRFRGLGGLTFADALDVVRRTAMEDYAHQEVPYELIAQEAACARRGQLTAASFSLGYPANLGLRLAGVDAEWLPAGDPPAMFDLSLRVEVGDDHADLCWIYDGSAFETSTIEALAEHYLGLLEGVLDRPALPLNVLPARPAAALAPSTAPVGDIVSRFARIAERHPGSPAVLDGPRVVGYAELDAWSNRLAGALTGAGVGRESRVGIRLPRGADWIAAALAVLKAGAAYVPLGHEDPPERVRTIIREAAVTAVIGDLPDASVPVLAPDAGTEGTEPVAGHPQALAYVMFTSGSTGVPKAVGVTHVGVLGLVVGANHDLVRPGDRVAHLANPAFDAATLEIWGPLLNGGQVVVLAKETVLSPQALREACVRLGVTVLSLTSALVNDSGYRAALRAIPLRVLTFGGDVAAPDALRDLVTAGCAERVVHTYGPTEATMLATYDDGPPGPDLIRLPVGVPVSGTEVRVAGTDLRGTWDLAPGEICVAGPRLARGYLNSPTATALRFVPHPNRPGERLYRTGDRGRRRDGKIEFLGRGDHQVKISGHRVEPGEVEACLSALPGVTATAVFADKRPGRERLVACVAGDPSLTVATVRDQLRRRLPDHLIPAAVHLVPAIPLTPNGKADRAALAAALPAPASAAGRPLGSALEVAVAAVWARCLGLPSVGADDDFFDLGGDSLLAIRLLAMVEETCGVAVPPAVLLAEPTVAAVARHVSGYRETASYDRGAVRIAPIRLAPTGPALVFAPPIGGGVMSYAPLVRALPPEVSFVTFELGGDEPTEVRQIAADALAALPRELPPGGIVFCGWSAGGVIAQEMARQATDVLQVHAPVVLMDSLPYGQGDTMDTADLLRDFLIDLGLSVSGRLIPADPAAADERAVLAEALSWLTAQGFLAGVTLDDLHGRYRTFRRNFAAYRDHVPVFYPGTTHLLAASMSVVPSDVWKRVSGRLYTHLVKGDHYSILRSPTVGTLARILTQVATDQWTARTPHNPTGR